MAGIDEYTLKARVCPVLLIAALPALALGCLFPEMDWKTAAAPPTVLIACALVAAAFGRDRGKRREPQLYESWAGKPTTIMLRYRTGMLPERQLAHLHRFLAAVTRNTIPTPKREEADPAAADVVYESFARHLREATRDTKRYPLVFRELTHYGFMRNLWGLRGTAITFAAVSFVATAASLAAFPPGGWDVRWLGPVFNVLAAVLWAWWPDRTAVRTVADGYAQALLAAGLAMAAAEPDDQPGRS